MPSQPAPDPPPDETSKCVDPFCHAQDQRNCSTLRFSQGEVLRASVGIVLIVNSRAQACAARPVSIFLDYDPESQIFVPH